jgi:hypothetical protein
MVSTVMYRLYVLMPFVTPPFSVVYGLPYSNSCYMAAFGVLLQLVRDNDNYMRITWGRGGCNSAWGACAVDFKREIKILNWYDLM